MRVTSNDSSSVIGGRIPGSVRASMVLPEPGGPNINVVGSLGPPPEAARALQYIPEAAAVAYEWF